MAGLFDIFSSGTINDDRLPAGDGGQAWSYGGAGLNINQVLGIGTDLAGNKPTIAQSNAAATWNAVKATVGAPTTAAAVAQPQSWWDTISGAVKDESLNLATGGAYGVGKAVLGDNNPISQTVDAATGALGDWVGRIAIVLLGFIFVAAGLAMFKPGVVIAARDAVTGG